MAEENTTGTTAPPDSQAEAPQPDPVQEWLAKVTPDELIKNDRVRGIFGQRLQTEREKIRQEMQEENQRAAMIKAQEELDRLAVEAPEEFAQRYLSSKEQERIRQQEQTLKAGIRSEFAKKTGEAVRSLTEFQDITPEEFGKLQASLAGKSDDEAIAAFNATAIDIIADRRSQKRLQDWRAKDLAKEREAIRAEEAAKGLQTSQRPDMARGNQPAPFDPTRLSPKEFDTWYRQNMLGRR